MQVVKNYCFLFLILGWGTVGAQCLNSKAFSDNEILNYDIVYNWHKIWVTAGEVSFNVKKGVYKNQDIYDCTVIGKSTKNWDWLYNVNDYFHAYIDTCSLRSLFFEQRTKEGGYKTTARYEYNHEKDIITTLSSTSKRPYFADTIHKIATVFDVVNAVYYFRSKDFSSIKAGEKIALSLLIDGKAYPIYLRFIGCEVLTMHDKRKYKARKFSAMMVEGTIFNAGEDLYLWVTDDDNKLALMVEAKILVGSVKAVLKSCCNLRHPFTSEIITGTSKK